MGQLGKEPCNASNMGGKKKKRNVNTVVALFAPQAHLAPFCLVVPGQIAALSVSASFGNESNSRHLEFSRRYRKPRDNYLDRGGFNCT